ncbi:hypothetical protein EB118_04195 [bacterium]|nr:hypothetical protein [bacterium]
MNSILVIIAAILGILNLFNANKRKRVEEKLRTIERDHHDEKLKLIQKERDAARDRLRDLLDHYRGPEGKA